MCGIFGYLGDLPGDSVCIGGLKSLEYRGYDSAGIATSKDGAIVACKQVGKVSALEELLKLQNCSGGATIAHTRWATHGKPSIDNAHPHFDSEQNLAIVHNGIIENFQSLKRAMHDKGAIFTTETDSEVIAKLVSAHYQGNLLQALQTTATNLQGSYAIALVHKNHPDEIVACAYESPLAVGMCDGECYISSDANAFKGKAVQVAFLQNGEFAHCHKTKIEFYDRNGKQIEKELINLNLEEDELSKNGFEHFMLKEIHEQPQTLQEALEGRLQLEFGTAHFEELELTAQEMQKVHRIVVIACGTSWHAGLIGVDLFESLARIPSRAEIASEFRYTNPLIDDTTLVIAISQSGETADTIAAVREAKAKGAKVLGMCNVAHSTLTREADSTLFLRAGQEVSVCSTKAFTSQLMLLSLFALFLGRQRHLSKADGQKFIQDLQNIPLKVRQIIASSKSIEKVASKYNAFENFFFLGRRMMFPTSLEAALKLKEISYLNAIAYPAGEMKHGPIALAGPSLAVLGFGGNRQTRDKLYSNLMEVKARSSPILLFTEDGDETAEIANDTLFLPPVCDLLAPILYSVAGQLFAYYIAIQKGTDIDQPRNLAKSVTVE
ncbi:MAG: glutamine--fructose-6-phosphate transaminase (isomerizing) [Chlamydiales bacterium]|nr:glutamine--fructose-6-phosphate transaminase (isomerizing) [Chlamydiales bacterium]